MRNIFLIINVFMVIVFPGLTLFAFTGSVSKVSGSNVTIKGDRITTLSYGTRIYFVENEKILGEGEVREIFFTKAILKLKSGSTKKGMSAVTKNEDVYWRVKSENCKCIEGDCMDGIGKEECKVDGFQYSGKFKNGRRNGKGTAIFYGEEIAGKWKNDNLVGQVKWNSYLGEISGKYMGNFPNFSGICIEGDCLNGKSKKYIYRIGFYTGDFKDGNPYGEGIFECNSLSPAPFINCAKEFFPDNPEKASLLSGNIQKPQKGKWIGYILCQIGDCENGHGVGISMRGLRLEGNFKNAVIQKEGILVNQVEMPYDLNFGNWKYEGGIKNNLMHGEGVLTFADGTVLKGTFYQNFYCKSGNCKDGNGAAILIDGREYTGDFQNFEWHGKGVLKLKNNGIYQGFFQENSFWEGFYMNEKGEITENYKEGQRIGK
ncbi:MAG: hypothetical protein HUU45_11560 [Leptospiraceae bacterium]|nr:hypothetical protein [Leptospiraceae bacterium]